MAGNNVKTVQDAILEREPNKVLTVNDIAPPCADEAAIKAQLPSEPVCPKIPGFVADVIPEYEVYGNLTKDAISDITSLAKRVTNPPSGKSMIKELADNISTLDDKLIDVTTRAGNEIYEETKRHLIAAKDEYLKSLDDLELVLEAVTSGAIELTQDILCLPVDVLVKSFNGFKNIDACFNGEKNSSEANYRNKSDETKKGLADGAGASAAAVVDYNPVDVNGKRIKFASTSYQGKTYTVESAEKVKVKDKSNVIIEIITVDEMIARGVPISNTPIAANYREVDSDYINRVGISLT